jgi:uncharacterized protein
MTRIEKQCFTLFFTLFYLIWALRATLFYSAVDLSISAGVARLIFSNLVKGLLWVLPAVIYLCWVERQNPLVVMRITTSMIRWKLAALVCLIFFILVFTVEYFATGRSLLPLFQAAPATLLSALFSVSVSPVFEELLFRGLVLPKLQENTPFWRANLAQSFLFTLVHWPNWLWTKGFQPDLLVTSASIFLLGCLLGWLVQRTNSIWPPVMIHIVNNFFSAFLG